MISVDEGDTKRVVIRLDIDVKQLLSLSQIKFRSERYKVYKESPLTHECDIDESCYKFNEYIS